MAADPFLAGDGEGDSESRDPLLAALENLDVAHGRLRDLRNPIGHLHSLLLREQGGSISIPEGLGLPFAEVIPAALEGLVSGPVPQRVNLDLRFPMPDRGDRALLFARFHAPPRACQRIA